MITLTASSLALCADCKCEVTGAHDCRERREVRRMTAFERLVFLTLRESAIRARAK